MLKFYDTCVLLDYGDEIFQQEKDNFFVSDITLTELEEIKTSYKKDESIKAKARHLLKLFDKYPNKYTVIVYQAKHVFLIWKKRILAENINNDIKIIACAASVKCPITFVTNDIACKTIAKEIFKLEVESFKPKHEKYTGYYKIILTEEELADFYNNEFINNANKYNLYENQYLLIECNEQIVDKYRYTSEGYKKVSYNKPTSKMFGTKIPFKFDNIQQLGLDSLTNNKITMLRGPAGSGKSCLAFLYMFNLLEKGKIDKIVIFCNTVATRGSAKLGFYPGSRTEKLLDSQIGNLLISKLGDRLIVEKLIDEGQLILLPFSDIRGYDTSGMNAAVYITEAQNLDIELMRLALQRIGDDSICIIDGDDNAQVDLDMYAGMRNGMKRVSQIFRGHDFYGEVTLNVIHRSAIAELAQKL